MNLTKLAFVSLAALGSMPLAAQTADDLFDDRVLQEVRVTIHPSDWKRLHDNYLENTYYAAEFQWRGILTEEVAIRSRGLGSRNTTKPGLRVDFNRFAPGRDFLGLKSLVLDNVTQDPSMIKERISLQLFRTMGIPAPREAHARLYVNGLYAGLYVIVEPVDLGFLKRNLPEDSGFLYDYTWKDENWFEYRGSNPTAYAPAPFEPKTREHESDGVMIERMIRAINQSTSAEFLDAVSPYLDLKAFLDYLATETYIGDGDGFIGDWGVNNLYLYRFNASTKFTLIPWDKDFTFRDARRSIWQNTERNVLTRRVLAVPDLREYYLKALERLIEFGGGPDGWLEKEVERQYRQVQLAAIEDTSKPFPTSQFESEIAALRSWAVARSQFMANQITDDRASR